jgi:hypothetical protein
MGGVGVVPHVRQGVRHDWGLRGDATSARRTACRGL